MKIKLITAVAAAAIILFSALVAPSLADARYYMSNLYARQATIATAVDKYDNYDTDATCRPFGLYKHRYVCDWWGYWDQIDEDTGEEETLYCHGTISITGSRAYPYYYGIVHGERCY